MSEVKGVGLVTAAAPYSRTKGGEGEEGGGALR